MTNSRAINRGEATLPMGCLRWRSAVLFRISTWFACCLWRLRNYDHPRQLRRPDIPLIRMARTALNPKARVLKVGTRYALEP